MDSLVKKYNMPDKHGHFEEFGGKYVPETLIPALDELEQEYLKSKKDKKFQKEFFNLLKYYGGRPTPLYYAKRFSEKYKTKVYFKQNTTKSQLREIREKFISQNKVTLLKKINLIIVLLAITVYFIGFAKF